MADVIPDRLFCMNQALINLGIAQKIQEENTGPFARTIAAKFDIALGELLSENEWNFAIAYQTLSQIDETPEDKNYKYSYLLPVNPKNVRGLKDSTSGEIIYDYNIVYGDGNDVKVHTNRENIQLKYIKDVPLAAMPDEFIGYFCAYLAWECRNNHILDGKKMIELEKTVNAKRRRAYMVDADSQPLTGLDTASSILDAHNFGGDYLW